MSLGQRYMCASCATDDLEMLIWARGHQCYLGSGVTLANNGSDKGLSLSVARTAWSHHIVARSTKS